MKGIFKAVLVFSLLIFSLSSFALSGFTMAVGTGSPNELRGARASFIWDWSDDDWFPNRALAITGFWDVSMAYWSTDGDSQGRHKRLFTIAAAPAIRLTTNHRLNWPVSPYFEASLGVALQSNDHIGSRGLGSHFTFQDMVGIGLIFGKKRQFSLSYHYLHYSNARIFPPNDGIDVKSLFRLVYRFV